MYHVNSHKTLVRHDSSLIKDPDFIRNLCLTNKSIVIEKNKPRDSVQMEVVTSMFESMLSCIIESWEHISPPESSDDCSNDKDPAAFEPTESSNKFLTVKKKRSSLGKHSKISKRSQMKIMEWQENDKSFKHPEDRVTIRFRNGNIYEGTTSMKMMNGEGRFQWSDGTIYIGHFKDNEITGSGRIQWKDDTWYEGEFSGNIRHGKGLYVDSRLQRSYAGEWHYGAKHGKGVIYYTGTFKNFYDGNWIMNQRIGEGVREYCASSAYIGEWDDNTREGKGIMIWPNNDHYQGEWKNGVMSGKGMYVWDAYFNNSMSLPSMKAYRGTWNKGNRHGWGIVNFGTNWGSFYQGQFKNNKKHGEGILVTNNGVSIESKSLFVDDIISPKHYDNQKLKSSCNIKNNALEPYYFHMEDSTAGLHYHITTAFNNIDRHDLIIQNLVNEYLQNNQPIEKLKKKSQILKKNVKVGDETNRTDEAAIIQAFFNFEEISLHKAIAYYITELKNVYYTYAKICNTEEIYFTPVMIRLYLWQLYYDCKINEKGLTLYDIDILYYQNREWLARRLHDPFEKIYFWQFLHSLISVAIKLYAKKEMPGPRPDTVVASAFKTFIENDLLPHSNRRSGRLVNGYGVYVPLKATYALYTSLGEPHTIRTFIRALRYSSHFLNRPENGMINSPKNFIPWGRNQYTFGDNLIFCVENNVDQFTYELLDDKKLFNLSNIPIKEIINIFCNIFPQVKKNGNIMDLEINLTFWDFFEVFIECIEKSIRVKDEETKRKHKFPSKRQIVPHTSPAP